MLVIAPVFIVCVVIALAFIVPPVIKPVPVFIVPTVIPFVPAFIVVLVIALVFIV